VQAVENQLAQALRNPDSEAQARTLAENLALALQAGLMIQYSSPAMAEAFLASRLSGKNGYNFGTLPMNVDINAILSHS